MRNIHTMCTEKFLERLLFSPFESREIDQVIANSETVAPLVSAPYVPLTINCTYLHQVNIYPTFSGGEELPSIRTNLCIRSIPQNQLHQIRLRLVIWCRNIHIHLQDRHKRPTRIIRNQNFKRQSGHVPPINMDSRERLRGFEVDDDVGGGREGRLPGCAVGGVNCGDRVLTRESGLVGGDDGFTLGEVAWYDGGVEIGAAGRDGEGVVYGEGVHPLHSISRRNLYLSHYLKGRIYLNSQVLAVCVV